MRFRAFGRLDWESSVLGIGVMRLPGFAEGGPGVLDGPEAVRIDPSRHRPRHQLHRSRLPLGPGPA